MEECFIICEPLSHDFAFPLYPSILLISKFLGDSKGLNLNLLPERSWSQFATRKKKTILIFTPFSNMRIGTV